MPDAFALRGKADVEPVPIVERMAYVLREWEDSHAVYSNTPITINGRVAPLPTEEEPEPAPYGHAKTECVCRNCQDTRTVLEAYEAAGGDAKAERIRY